MTIPEVVAKVLRDCCYWAPEVRALKLCDLLDAYGDPLYEALLALSPEEREDCGINNVRRGGAP